MTDTPGSTVLNEEQRQWFQDRLGERYVAVADGSKGGHTPGQRYGHGKMALIKTKRRGR